MRWSSWWPAVAGRPTDQPFEVTYDITATGSLTLNDVRAELQLDSATATAANADGGTCTIDAPGLVRCQLGLQ